MEKSILYAKIAASQIFFFLKLSFKYYIGLDIVVVVKTVRKTVVIMVIKIEQYMY